MALDLLRGAIRPSTLYYGDCLDVMREWDKSQVDLIYLDPPFNSKANYNILFGENPDGKSGQFMAFEDTWAWDAAAAKRVEDLRKAKANPAHRVIEGFETILGPSGMLAYISYMAERLYECHRILKSRGSMYLHCDPTASHYLKVLMDAVFTQRTRGSFRNEIAWYYANASRGKRWWAKAHDIILWYSKDGKEWTFNRDDVLTPFTSGMTAWRYTHGGQKGKKMPEGKTPDDVICLPALNAMSKERTGYPTQKPLDLLDLLVRASSNPGDLILDPFCGCGTAVVAANRLDRRWAGIDISAFAVETVMQLRLRKVGIPVSIEGIPVDLHSASLLAAEDPFKFETWAVIQVPGLYPNDRQRGDQGVDGRGTLLNRTEEGKDGVVVQVKSGKATQAHLRDFLHVLDRDDAAAGVFMTLEKKHVTRPMRRLAGAQGSFRIKGSPTEYPRVQFWSLEEWFRGKKKRGALPLLPAMANPVTGKRMQETLWESR